MDTVTWKIKGYLFEKPQGVRHVGTVPEIVMTVLDKNGLFYGICCSVQQI